MKKEKLTYSQAIERLKQIVSQTSNEEIDIDLLCQQLKEAQELIKFCQEKLTNTDKEIKSILQSDKK